MMTILLIKLLPVHKVTLLDIGLQDVQDLIDDVWQGVCAMHAAHQRSAPE